MALLVGVYDAEPGCERAEACWRALTAGRGEPLARACDGPLRAALYAQHEGERTLAPAAPAQPDELLVGFGGGPIATLDALTPPWLCCRYDPRSRSVSITTDRYGFALVYVRSLGNTVAFSTSAMALGRLEPAAPEDPDALAEILAFDHLLGTRTRMAGVSALPAGHALELSPRGMRITRRFAYGDISMDAHRAQQERLALELVVLWRAAVAAAAGSRGDDEPVLLPLSGGLDSRLIAAALAELSLPVEAFTFGQDALEPRRPPDVAIAQRVARTLGLPWRALPLDTDWFVAHAQRAAALTDGQCSAHHAAGISVLTALAPGRLRLDGIGGDVVLGGMFLQRSSLAARTARVRLEAVWRSRARLDHPGWQALLLPAARDELRARARASLADSLERAQAELRGDDPRWFDAWTLRNRTRRFINNGPLLWQKRVQTRFPFFEPAFFDRVFAVDPQLRLGGQLQATVLRAGWPALAAIPWQKTGQPVRAPGWFAGLRSRLGPRAYPRGVPFFDFDAAFRSSAKARAFLRDVLLDPSTGVSRFGCFDRAEVKRLLDATERGQERGMSRLALLATLVLSA